MCIHIQCTCSVKESNLLICIVQQLYDCVYYFNAAGAQLEMFGSSTNGFGMRSSDLDLCLKGPVCSEVRSTLLQYPHYRSQGWRGGGGD